MYSTSRVVRAASQAFYYWLFTYYCFQQSIKVEKRESKMMPNERRLDGNTTTSTNATSTTSASTVNEGDSLVWIINIIVLLIVIFGFLYYYIFRKEDKFNPFVFGQSSITAPSSSSLNRQQLTPYQESVIRRAEEKELKYIENTDQRRTRIRRYFDRNSCRMIVQEGDIILNHDKRTTENMTLKEEDELVNDIENPSHEETVSVGIQQEQVKSDEDKLYKTEDGTRVPVINDDEKKLSDIEDHGDDDDVKISASVEKVVPVVNDDVKVASNDVVDIIVVTNEDNNVSNCATLLPAAMTKKNQVDTMDEFENGYLFLRTENYVTKAENTDGKQPTMMNDNNEQSSTSDNTRTNCVTNCCAICLDSYEPNDVVVWSPVSSDCQHAFHENCILDWMCTNQKGTPCPMCRQDILPNLHQFYNGKYIKQYNMVAPQSTFNLSAIKFR